MRQNRSYYFLALLALPLLIVFQNPQTVESLHNASLALMRPFLVTGNSLTRFVIDRKEDTVLFWETFRENKIHQDEIARLESRLTRFDEMSRENVRLRSLLRLKETLPSASIAASVIGWDPSIARKVVILDKGLKDGIRRDMPVVAEEGLVGRVLEVGPATSRAILLTDPDARVSAVTSKSRSQGVAGGDGSDQMQMFYLELDGGAAVEEDVLTSGVGEIFPKGLRIGKILALEKSQEGLHLTAKVQPYVRFSKLEEVLCLVSSRRKS